MGKVSEKIIENIKAHTYYVQYLFSDNRAVYEIMIGFGGLGVAC